MMERTLLLVRRTAYTLRGGFLVRPLAIALTLGLVGASLSWLEQTTPEIASWVPRMLFPSHSDPQLAQVILGGIAASIMTVVSIVFAILLMTLTLASMQFSPRIIVSFVRDQVVQWTLGIFLGTFCYCMAALPAARSVPAPFAPVVTVLGAMALAVACVVLLLFFIHHISQAISVNHIVDRIAAETIVVINDLMPHPRRYGKLAVPDTALPPGWRVPITSKESGYLRFVDTKRLVDVAKETGVRVAVARRVGQFVPAGGVLLRASSSDRLTPDAAEAFLTAFDLGPTRTLQQDVEFGVLQIVDIALRAISPAVNDPSTAISCVDQLSRILIEFASRELPDGLLYDPPGTLRVSVPWLNRDGMLDSAFEQIRMYSKGDIAVSLRILRALGDVASTVPHDEHLRRVILERGIRLVAGCAEKVNQEELYPLSQRLTTLREATHPLP